VAIAPRTGKNITKGVLERGENLLQNGVPHFLFMLSRSSEIVWES